MTIREWLQDPSDYTIGLSLYDKYGSLANFKKILSRGGATDSNRTALIYELKKIIGKDETIVSEWDGYKFELKKVDDIPVVYDKGFNDSIPKPISKQYDSTNDPEEVSELRKSWRAAYKQAVYLHNNLLKMDVEERKEAAFEILNLFEGTIQPAWDKIDHYKKHGSLPEAPVAKPIEEMDIAKLITRRNTVRANISKCKSGTLKMSRLAEFEAELKLLEQKING